MLTDILETENLRTAEPQAVSHRVPHDNMRQHLLLPFGQVSTIAVIPGSS